jgi:hypothetical protein
MTRQLVTCLIALLVISLLADAPATAESRLIDLAIGHEELSSQPRVISIMQDDEVTLRVSSDKAVEFHVHGYDIEQSLSPGLTVSLRFTARATGRFPMEVHGEQHRGKVVGYLEVRPR